MGLVGLLGVLTDKSQTLRGLTCQVHLVYDDDYDDDYDDYDSNSDN